MISQNTPLHAGIWFYILNEIIMARFLKGIHGAYSGKVGNVIGSNWRNVDYVRSVAKPSNKPATEKQLAQRARFGLAVSFLSPIKDVLNLGYSDRTQTKSTGYNKALQHLLNHGVVGSYPDFELDYAAVSVSRGSLNNLMGAHWQESAPRVITMTWETEVNRFNAFVDDAVILLMYNIDKAFFSILESGTRGDGSIDVTMPEAYTGDRIVGWVFTGHRDGIKTSSSYYLGEITLS